MSLFYFKAFVGNLSKKIHIEWEAPTMIEKFLIENQGKKMWADIGRETGIRTLNQNASLHLLCEQISEALNIKGISVQDVLLKKQSMKWNMMAVKELLWRDAQIKVTGNTSSTKLDKLEDINIIHDHLMKNLHKYFNINIPWPSKITSN